MKPSARLATVVVIVLASILVAAALQIRARLSEIASYDRGQTAVTLVSRLQDVDAAIAAYDPAATDSRRQRDEFDAVVATIRATDRFASDSHAEAVLGPGWALMRDGWLHAGGPAETPSLATLTEATMRDLFLRVAAIALARGSDASLEGPLSEAALLSMPLVLAQERRMTAAFDEHPQLGDLVEHDPTVTLAERTTRAQTIASVGFMALDSPWAAHGVPTAVRAQAETAHATSRAYLTDVENSIEQHALLERRARLAARGNAAVAQLAALQQTLLPLLSERLQRARNGAAREITITAVIAGAIITLIGVLSVQALRSQARSLLSREALAYQARHDALTGLPNRRAFADAISEAVTAWTPINDRTVWIMSIDLDYFKEVNDRYGHQVGDAFLVAAAQRLRHAVPPNDVVARVGGDEFAVLVHSFDPDSSYPLDLAQSICDAFDTPIEIDRIRHPLAASVGVVSVDSLHDTVDSLLRDADIAMYRAKETGGDRVVAFDDDLRQAIVFRAELAADLPTALREGDAIGVAFQPILSLDDGSCYGFEALVRWLHPIHGYVDAGLLIDIAQESRVIDELGRLIVHEVCRHLATWRHAGIDLEALSVHVNISPMEAVHADTFGSIAHALETYGIPPHTLVVELTETASMDSIEAASLFLSLLHAMDVRICLDDFGTGYSSLRHLNDFHVDVIKIDRSFVVSAARDPAKVPIIAGIVALANGLNASVIAEGIETRDQEAVIEHIGCRLVQGYLFARPLTPEDALTFARESTIGLPPVALEV